MKKLVFALIATMLLSGCSYNALNNVNMFSKAMAFAPVVGPLFAITDVATGIAIRAGAGSQDEPVEEMQHESPAVETEPAATSITEPELQGMEDSSHTEDKPPLDPASHPPTFHNMSSAN